MPFTKEDKILIKNLFEFKGYNARVFQKKLKKAVSKSCCNRYGLLVGRTSSRQC